MILHGDVTTVEILHEELDSAGVDTADIHSSGGVGAGDTSCPVDLVIDYTVQIRHISSFAVTAHSAPLSDWPRAGRCRYEVARDPHPEGRTRERRA